LSAERPADFRIEYEASRLIVEKGGRFFIWSQAVGGSFATIKTSLDEP
jgi:hypothetical protein